MAHGVQPHHVGSAEGARAGTAHFFARQVVYHVECQAEVLHLFHGGQHAGNADPVSDEVGRIFRAHHPFAQRAGDKSFQVVQNLRLGGGRVDQLHQRHITRRVEEVDAAKTRLDGIGQRLAQCCDRQARGVAGHNGTFTDEGRDLVVQVCLPVHAFGDGFNDQVAAAQQFHVLFVIRLLDQACVFGHTQGRRFQFLQAVNGFDDDGVFATRQDGCALLWRVGKIKQNDRNFDVHQVRGNLRTHHASAQNGDFFHTESGHVFPCGAQHQCTIIWPGPRSGCARRRRWSRGLPAFFRPQPASGAAHRPCRFRGRESCRLPTRLCLRTFSRPG